VFVFDILGCGWIDNADTSSTLDFLNRRTDSIPQLSTYPTRVLRSDASVFIAALEELLASGEAVLASVQVPQDGQPGVSIVGYRDAHFVYLLPEISYREIQRIRPLHFSATAIGSQLKEDGWLMTNANESHLTVQIRIRGNRVRVWRLKASLFSGDSGDSGDVNAET
jgi:hypothetical protein